MESEFLDPPLSREQADLCAWLSPEQPVAIDSALLSHCAGTWRKAALVIGSALHEVRVPGVPDVFFALRLKEHVARGRLEGRGDLSSMRYSEVRVPAVTTANAT